MRWMAGGSNEAGGLVLDRIDPLNLCAVRIEAYFNALKLSEATGFFHSAYVDEARDENKVFWLVSNWHVFSGRHADQPLTTLNAQGAVPNRLVLSLPLLSGEPEYEGEPEDRVLYESVDIRLYDSDHAAIWRQHSDKSRYDVAAINVGDLFRRYYLTAVNEHANEVDMRVDVGNEVFILGYPLGFSHFANAPIWKRGSIASEPHIETSEGNARVIIDATTRSGMSGSPVIMRAKTHYVDEDGQVKLCVNATRWLGIYASRPSLPSMSDATYEDSRPEVGYFFKGACVADVITSGLPGPGLFDAP